MKIKCQKCGRMIDASNYLCPYCQGENPLGDGEVLSLWQDDRRKRLKIRLIVIISVIAALFLIGFILNKNLLFPTQRLARMNRKAVREYVAQYYPEAVLVDEHFYSIENYFVGPPSTDVFVYNLNSVEFEIYACNGIVWDEHTDKPAFVLD